MTNTHYIGALQDNVLREDSSPYNAYKIGMFRWNKGKPVLVPPHFYKNVTELNADSLCKKKHRTAEDFEACSCGFYGYYTVTGAAAHAEEFNGGSNCFIMQVSLSGAVIVAEKGLKATHQRVKSIVVPECFKCDNLSTMLVDHKSRYMVGVCDSCAQSVEHPLVSFAEFSAAARIPGFSDISVLSSTFDPEQLEMLYGNRDAIQKVMSGYKTLETRGDVISLLQMKIELDEVIARMSTEDNHG